MEPCPVQLVVVKLLDLSVDCSVGSRLSTCPRVRWETHPKLTDSQSEGYDRDYYAQLSHPLSDPFGDENA